jgi:hypothetical protein
MPLVGYVAVVTARAKRSAPVPPDTHPNSAPHHRQRAE